MKRPPSAARSRLERCTVLLAWLVFLSAVWSLSDVRPRAPRAVPSSAAAATDEAVLKLRVRPAEGSAVRTARLRAHLGRGERYFEVADRAIPLDEPVELGALPRGELWLLVEAPGHARASRRLDLRPGAQALTLELEPAHALAVRVNDEAGNPLGGATVLVAGDDPLPHGALVRADGRARFERLDAPPWVITVAAPGFETATRQGVRGDLTVTLRALGVLAVQVEHAAGTPAVGATVTLVGTRLWPARQAMTDATGYARIAGLLAGSYDLRATLGGEVSDTLLGLALAPSARETVKLRLQPGRFVEVVVTDGDDELAEVVPNADVVVVEDGLGPFPERGRTGTDGKVRLGPLRPGPATVSARADGFVARSGVPVPEAPGEAVRVALVRAARLEGEVVDAHGRPIEGASIEVVGTDLWGMPVADSPGAQSFQSLHFAWSLGGPVPLVPAGELGVMPGPVPPIPRAGDAPLLFAQLDLGPEAEAARAAWVSGMDGRFSAAPVTPGRVRAFVHHPAYVEGISDPVVIPPGATARVRVVLEVGGNLEGRLVDERGFPVAGARIEIVAAHGTTAVTTFTADDGTFAFAAIPAEVTVSLARPEAPTRIVLTRPLVVPAERTTKLALVLPAEREPVRVRVVDGDGRAVEAAQVTALGADPAAPYRETRFTDPDGLAELPDARGRALTLRVEAPRLTRATLEVAAAGAELKVALVTGVIVSGRVTAVRGRLPVEGARVTLVADGQRLAALTDRDGRYQLRDVPPGRVHLVITHAGHATAERDVTVERTGRDDRPRELPPVDLVEPGAVEGVVRDTAGKPVVGARVAVGVAPSFLPAGRLPPGIAVTDSTGRFRLDALAPGTVELEAYAADVGRGFGTATVVEGKTAGGLVIVLDEPAGEDEPPASGNLAVTLGERGDPPEVVVVHVAADSEAERSGIRAGDVVLEVDGVEVVDMADARARLAGRAGSDVVVTVQRGEGEQRLRVAREAVRR